MVIKNVKRPEKKSRQTKMIKLISRTHNVRPYYRVNAKG